MAKTKKPIPPDHQTKNAALDEIDRRLGAHSGLAAASLSAGGMCGQYHDIRDYLVKAMDFIGSLPHGDTIKQIIHILMEIADLYCGTPTAASASVAPSSKAAGEAAILKIDSILNTKASAAASVSMDDICKQYHAIRGYIEPALGFIEWVPYGPTIAKIVRLLVKLADAVC